MIKKFKTAILSMVFIFLVVLGGVGGFSPPASADKLNPVVENISVSVTTSSSTVIPARKGRRYLLIQNVGTVNVGVSIGTASIGSAGTFTLLPDAVGVLVFEGDFVPWNAFNAIAASGTGVLSIWEGI